MQKKGDIWISAILYFGLGIIIITILLSAGLPVINRLRDKNVVIQSKQVMSELDQNIREVIKEGPGSQRIVTVNLKKGLLKIDEEKSQVMWQYNNSKVLISDPGTPVFEGKLTILTLNSTTKGSYNIEIYTDYAGVAKITRPANKQSTLIGITDLVVRNEGLDNQNKLIRVSVSETNK